jgi:GTP pyrophosphokinase
MPLRTPLQNGDQIEIITSRAQTPSPAWERFVVTGRARARIRRFIRSKEREQYLQLGRSMLQQAFSEKGYELSEKALEGVVKNFKQQTVEDLIAQVGAGHVTARSVVETVYPATRRRRAFYEKVVPLGRGRAKKAVPKAPGIPIRGLIPGMALHYAGCCHPLPGDRIVGIVTTGKGVTIHTIDCENLHEFNDMPDRWIDVAWDVEDGHQETYVGRLLVTVLNEPGSLGALTMVIARNDGNITNLKLTNRTPEFFDMLIDVEVRDVRHMTDILADLRATPAVTAADRARG